jgi:hypothetical protein
VRVCEAIPPRTRPPQCESILCLWPVVVSRCQKECRREDLNLHPSRGLAPETKTLALQSGFSGIAVALQVFPGLSKR